MARTINLRWNGKESVFDMSKVDRQKLYGKRQRIVLDDEGERCVKAELSDDGSTLIKSGMVMQAYFDSKGEWVESARLVGLDEAGQPVEKVPSTLGEFQDAEEATPEEVSQNKMMSLYHLSENEVDGDFLTLLNEGKIFRFPFNYRADYCAEVGFILANKEGVFVLVTQAAEPQWCELEDVAMETFEEGFDSDDELDFEMF